jgi:acetylornithine/succinyldiaminopimelate/putrescine aminotransferase
MAMHDAEYPRRARALCDRYEVHLIADEIMTASGAPAPSTPTGRPASRRIS